HVMPSGATKDGADKLLPKAINERLRYYFFVFLAWRTVHYTFGLLALISSVLVASYDEAKPVVISRPVLAIIAAVCTGMLTFLGAAVKSDGFFRAWRLLVTVATDYRLGRCDEAALSAAQA